MKPATTASPGTECKNQPLLFQELGSRKVVSDFSGGTLSSDGGVLLVRQVDGRMGLTKALAQCFTDRRDQVFIDHSVQELVTQRVYGMALGYEDINDHDVLRLDPLMAVACEKRDPNGMDRLHQKGVALAASSTLNRLELSNNKTTRYHKLSHDPQGVQSCLLEMGVNCLPRRAREVVLDIDAMGYVLHGLQEGRHFRANFNNYCYMPLYGFVGDIPLWAQLRTSNQDDAAGVVPALEQMVRAIRKRCPGARIVVRGDSGFCREEIMAWCERQRPVVYYCLGMAKSSALIERLQGALADARAHRCLTGTVSTRVFTEFTYQTTKSWSRHRRVIGKAEVMADGDNPRFIVTNLPAEGFKEEDERDRFCPARLYEELYCGRGDMENMLKQQVLDLQSDRMSTHHLASNQLRLWLATLAYLLLRGMRHWGCQGTELAKATVGSIRLKLLKVAAQVTVSVRRVHVRLSSAWPAQDLFVRCARRLGAGLGSG
jgi:hypothetical protein